VIKYNVLTLYVNKLLETSYASHLKHLMPPPHFPEKVWPGFHVPVGCFVLHVFNIRLGGRKNPNPHCTWKWIYWKDIDLRCSI